MRLPPGRLIVIHCVWPYGQGITALSETSREVPTFAVQVNCVCLHSLKRYTARLASTRVRAHAGHRRTCSISLKHAVLVAFASRSVACDASSLPHARAHTRARTHMHRGTERQRGREAGRKGGREAGRQGGKEAERQRNRDAEKQGGREAEAERQRGREAEKQRDRHAHVRAFCCARANFVSRRQEMSLARYALSGARARAHTHTHAFFGNPGALVQRPMK
eukprot:15460122-Alexandrium_andersonii.AAC.1